MSDRIPPESNPNPDDGHAVFTTLKDITPEQRKFAADNYEITKQRLASYVQQVQAELNKDAARQIHESLTVGHITNAFVEKFQRSENDTIFGAHLLAATLVALAKGPVSQNDNFTIHADTIAAHHNADQYLRKLGEFIAECGGTAKTEAELVSDVVNTLHAMHLKMPTNYTISLIMLAKELMKAAKASGGTTSFAE